MGADWLCCIQPIDIGMALQARNNRMVLSVTRPSFQSDTQSVSDHKSTFLTLDDRMEKSKQKEQKEELEHSKKSKKSRKPRTIKNGLVTLDDVPPAPGDNYDVWISAAKQKIKVCVYVYMLMCVYVPVRHRCIPSNERVR